MAGVGVPKRVSVPSPIRARATWLSGARSPEAPTEPRLGTTGVRPALRTAISVSTTTGRTPEWPRARLAAVRSIMPRTASSGSGSPTPAEWERIRFRCTSRTCSGSTRTREREPKPVFTP